NDIAVLRTEIALHENGLFQPGCEQVIDSRCKVVDVDAILVEVKLSVAGHRHKYRVVPVCFFHVDRISGSGELDALPLLQHGCNDHEDDQKDKHHVRHRRYVDVGGNFSSTSA